MSHIKTLMQIIDHIDKQHPEIRTLQIQKRKHSLSLAVANFHGWEVRHGPFSGLKFIKESHWGGSDKGLMILGLYEKEILDKLNHYSGRYKTFVDLGAADGYYGIGVLINKMFEKSYCFEINEGGREVIKKNALLNNCASNVYVHGEATSKFYEEISTVDRESSLLFIDIEGAEFEILTEDVFDAFKKSPIIVELHDWMVNDGLSKLQNIMKNSLKTHSVEFVKMGSRDLSEFPELHKWSDHDRWLFCSESRGQLMTWAIFNPKEQC